MRRRHILWALVGLNVLLVVTLVARLGGETTASAQVRRPSEYIMIPGEVGGGTSAVVYMIDSTNGLLGAMTYDDSRRELNVMPPIDLSRVFQTGPNVGARTAPGVAPGVGVRPGVRGVPGRP
jgi:hypothetical protein